MIDETIQRVERLYVTLTGLRPPHLNGNGAPMPPESDPLAHVEEQLARMVTLAEQLVVRPAPATPWRPRVTAWRDGKAFVLAIDVPGVTREQLDIRAEGHGITVVGQRAPAWSGERQLDACEAPFGPFARTFPVPLAVSAEHVTARLSEGVLTIRIDTTTRGEASQIPIRS